ncbi:MAG: endopeptidase La [Clostridia bacterium]|nr:endopeptidase La [Clostridia bacterium]
MKHYVEAVEETSLPVLALRGLTVFPGMTMHFDIVRKKSVAAAERAVKNATPLLLITQKDISVEDPTPADLYTVGTVSKVKQMMRLQDGNFRVLVEGIARGEVLEYMRTEPYFRARVLQKEIAVVDYPSVKQEALMRRLLDLLHEYAEMSPRLSPELVLAAVGTKDLAVLCDFLASNLMLRSEDKQEILEEFDPIRRAERLIVLLDREIEILNAEHEIEDKVKEQIDRHQREYYLREQIKAIQDELGDGDNPAGEALDFHERIRRCGAPDEAKQKLHQEADRLSKMAPGTPEATVVRTYLDTCLELPWNKQTKERTDVAHAKKVLDADHYGMEKVKERILESIAVRALAPDIKGQILCLVGAPGVGKTSIGRSVAKALNRKFARISLGGVRDEAEIRGHRKTYIGSMPGRIMNAVKTAGSSNALILLDEIDKLGNDYRGDPAAALLEVLDSEQNHSFRDHYIELPFDLSRVLFITTANTTETIPRPLLDRMEVIELPSYTREEKLEIAKRHLVGKQSKRHGLKRSDFSLSNDTLRALIDGYTREAGVRGLEREMASLFRKIAYRKVEGQQGRITVKPDNLESFLGPEKFKPEKADRADQIGVVNGLAWTQVGGELLSVEVNIMDGSGKIELTGQMGDVMKESAKAAVSYIRSRWNELGIADPDFYKNKDIHIHIPEGAVPKDGPSAGITMATALVSHLSGRPVRHDVAMTGEITLRGRVLPIGGLREKTMAAYIHGMKTVIIPEENLSDLAELAPTVRDALTFVPAQTMETVLAAALLPSEVEVHV